MKTVCALAQGVWSTCMQKHSRTANHHRSDRGVKRTMDGEPRSIVKEEGKPSEREFWRRSHQQTKMLTSSSASSSSAAPPVVDFDPGHTKELTFQNKKVVARYIEANLQGLLLPQEQTLAVQQATVIEQDRMHHSLQARLRHAEAKERSQFVLNLICVLIRIVKLRATSEAIDNCSIH